MLFPLLSSPVSPAAVMRPATAPMSLVAFAPLSALGCEEGGIEVQEVLVAIITGGLALVGVVITNVAGNRRAEEKLRIAQAVTDAKIDELTREVRKHNGFAEKMPVIQEQIKVINHRIADLENERKDHQ